MSSMTLVRSYILSQRGDDEILPTNEDEELDDYSGGLVLEQNPGLHDWVATIDLASLYPSTLITANISPETLTRDPAEVDVIVPKMPLNDSEVEGDQITSDDIGWDIEEGAYGYSLDKQGILPTYIRNLFKDRNQYKGKRDSAEYGTSEYKKYDDRQRSIKVIQNSIYGCTANKYFSLTRPGIAASITALSRYVTWTGIEIARDKGYVVVGSDTDSCMISLGDSSMSKEEALEKGRELERIINSRIDSVADDIGIGDHHPYLSGDLHGTDRHLWEFEFESLAKRGFFADKKKRYAKWLVWDEGKNVDEISITGFEAVRSDVPYVTESVQKAILEKVLKDEGFEDVSSYLKPVVKKVKNGDYKVTYLASPGVLNKPPEDYPNRPCPRGCIYTNEHLKWNFREGDRPYWVWISGVPDNKPMTDVIAIPWNADDLPEGFELDVDAHINKYVKRPIEMVLEQMNWKFSQLAEGRQTNVMDVEDNTNNPFE